MKKFFELFRWIAPLIGCFVTGWVLAELLWKYVIPHSVFGLLIKIICSLTIMYILACIHMIYIEWTEEEEEEEEVNEEV